MRVDDIEREAEFWEEGIGLPRVRPKSGEPIDQAVVFDIGGPRLELHRGGTPGPRPVGRENIQRTPVLIVDDSKAAMEQALAHGGQNVIEHTQLNAAASVVYVSSPEGHVVGLLQADERAYRARLGMPELNTYW
jgi:predicted enzyme related to lactoylglutathione lyase